MKNIITFLSAEINKTYSDVTYGQVILTLAVLVIVSVFIIVRNQRENAL